MPIAFISALALALTPQSLTPTPRSAVVSFGDLDLRTAKGAGDLRRRIDMTVEGLSGGADASPGSILESTDLAAARAKGRRQADALIREVRTGSEAVAADRCARPTA